MNRLAAFLAALLSALALVRDRLRVRWYRYRQLPTVREQLAQGALPAAARPLLSLRLPDEGPLAADETTRDVLSIPSSLRLVRGEPLGVFRVTRLPPLPPEPAELAVFQPARWPLERPLPPRPDRLRSGIRPLRPVRLPPPPIGVARPELFGIDPSATSARPERQSPPPLARPQLVPQRPRPVPAPRLPQKHVGIAAPEKLGLDAQLRPPSEQLPSLKRHPPRLSRARANFLVRYVDPHRSEALIKPIDVFFGETIERDVQGFFYPPNIGATPEEYSWEVDSDVTNACDEVREQYILRRDIDRPEMDDIEGLQVMEGFQFNGVQSFTGLEFEDLEPEPFEPLKMQLAAPPVDHRPPLEDTQAQLAWLLRAMGDFPPDKGESFVLQLPDGPPPVPEIP